LYEKQWDEMDNVREKDMVWMLDLSPYVCIQGIWMMAGFLS